MDYQLLASASARKIYLVPTVIVMVISVVMPGPW